LKERFAELLPEKIEQIKDLRKYERTSRPNPLDAVVKVANTLSLK
jgi:hypothetical protein